MALGSANESGWWERYKRRARLSGPAGVRQKHMFPVSHQQQEVGTEPAGAVRGVSPCGARNSTGGWWGVPQQHQRPRTPPEFATKLPQSIRFQDSRKPAWQHPHRRGGQPRRAGAHFGPCVRSALPETGAGGKHTRRPIADPSRRRRQPPRTTFTTSRTELR